MDTRDIASGEGTRFSDTANSVVPNDDMAGKAFHDATDLTVLHDDGTFGAAFKALMAFQRQMSWLKSKNLAHAQLLARRAETFLAQFQSASHEKNQAISDETIVSSHLTVMADKYVFLLQELKLPWKERLNSLKQLCELNNGLLTIIVTGDHNQLAPNPCLRLIELLKLFSVADQLKLIDLLHECDLLVMLLPPNKMSIDSFPIVANSAYVRYNSQLFYINKAEKKCIVLPVDQNVVHKFDQVMRPSERIRSLSQQELNEIQSITNDARYDNSQPFGLNKIIRDLSELNDFLNFFPVPNRLVVFNKIKNDIKNLFPTKELLEIVLLSFSASEALLIREEFNALPAISSLDELCYALSCFKEMNHIDNFEKANMIFSLIEQERLRHIVSSGAALAAILELHVPYQLISNYTQHKLPDPLKNFDDACYFFDKVLNDDLLEDILNELDSWLSSQLMTSLELTHLRSSLLFENMFQSILEKSLIGRVAQLIETRDGYSRVVLFSGQFPSLLENGVLYVRKISDDKIIISSASNGLKDLTDAEIKVLKDMINLSFPKEGEPPIEITRNKEPDLVGKIISACYTSRDFLLDFLCNIGRENHVLLLSRLKSQLPMIIQSEFDFVTIYLFLKGQDKDEDMERNKGCTLLVTLLNDNLEKILGKSRADDLRRNHGLSTKVIDSSSTAVVPRAASTSSWISLGWLYGGNRQATNTAIKAEVSPAAQKKQ